MNVVKPQAVGLSPTGLDRIRPTIQEMSSKGVPKQMRCDLLLNTCRDTRLPYNLTDRTHGQTPARTIEEKR